MRAKGSLTGQSGQVVVDEDNQNFGVLKRENIEELKEKTKTDKRGVEQLINDTSLGFVPSIKRTSEYLKITNNS